MYSVTALLKLPHICESLFVSTKDVPKTEVLKKNYLEKCFCSVCSTIGLLWVPWLLQDYAKVGRQLVMQVWLLLKEVPKGAKLHDFL